MSAPATESDERRLDFYIEVVRRRWRLVLVAVVVVTIVAILVSALQTRRFEATSAVLLNRQDLAGAIAGTPSQIQDPARLASTQAELARTPELARRVLARSAMRGTSVETLLRDLTVNPKRNSDILEFQLRAGTPGNARLLANSYATEFTRYTQQLALASVSRASARLEARLAQLRRTGQQATPVYDRLVADQRQLETLKALLGPSDVVVRTADRAEQVQPRPLRNAALGLALGLVLGLSLAFLFDALDSRVRSELEITSSLGVPLLARIPRAVSRVGPALTPPDALEAAVEAEAFRMLRANLQLAMLDGDARVVVVVTSAVPGEGKSTVVANLGVALARVGHDVILADIDLRKPSLHQIFGLGRRGGLTDVARRSTDVEEALVEVAIDRSGRATARRRVRTGSAPTKRKKVDEPGKRKKAESTTLRVLTAGPPPPDPGEFVESEFVDDVLMDLRAQSDIVLVDAPPLLTVGDATSLSMQADMLLLVMRPELLRRAPLEDLRRALASIPTPTVGFVVVGVEPNVPGYYYGMSADEPEPTWSSPLAWGKRRLSRPDGAFGRRRAAAPAPSVRGSSSGGFERPAGAPVSAPALEPGPPVSVVPELPTRDVGARRLARNGPAAEDDPAATDV